MPSLKAIRIPLALLLGVLFAPAATATPIQIYGVWHAGNDYCIWGSARTLEEFDSKNHWIIDRGDGVPSVNIVILSFIEPYKLLNRTTDAATLDGVPRGMTQEVVDYFKSRGIRVMISIGGITYVDEWEAALAQDATQLGLNAAEVAHRLGVGIEIDYEGSSEASVAALQQFIDAYRSVHPYDVTGSNHAARLTVDLAAGDRWLIELTTKATRDWLVPMNPILDYANAMVPARQPSVSGAIANWREHVDGKPQYNPPILPLAPCKFTGSLFLTQRNVTPECASFNASIHYATRDFVQNVAPNGAGTTPGMLGYMFWAAECQGTRSDCTTPPNSCEGGIGAGSEFFQIPIPMPPLRQDGIVLDSDTPGPAEFALYANAPNPFRSSTNVRFALPEPGRVDLRAYDVAGREIARIAAGGFPAGIQSIPWKPVSRTGAILRPGTYFYRLRVVTESNRTFDRTLRMTYVR
ncbi:MAG: hypothetical protein ACREOU_16120 [Candidatus Eiseniibacteriota bacterium]